MKITKNIPLLVGIALPIIFILIISTVVFTPSLFIKPQYNFLYSSDNSYDYYNRYSNTYEVKDGHIALTPVPPINGYAYKTCNPPLYLYDVKSNTSSKVEFNEVSNLGIDAGPSSPDGYSVTYKYSNDGIFGIFGGSNSSQNGYVISKGNGAKRLEGLTSSGYSYYNSGNFQLLGWVK